MTQLANVSEKQSYDIGAKPSVIDLFSGAGGLSQGLKQAGFDVIGAVEVKPAFAHSYSLNHKSTRMFLEDIHHLSPNSVMQELGLRPGDLDLLSGCPPCQGFSTIGTRNRKARDDDPRNDLIFDMLSFVEVMMPKTIMIENVPYLASDKRMAIVKNRFELLGYHTDIKILNMINYDVPQSRKRMIMLASNLGNIKVIERLVPPDKFKTVREAIGSQPQCDTSDDELHNYRVKRSERILRIISLIPKNGGSRSSLPENFQLKCHKKTTGFKDVYGRMSWDRPSPTITGGCTNPSKGRFLHPEENRAITLREASLLQTFPADYRFSFENGRDGIATMIGNALPPKFIEFHASYIKEHILQHTQNGH